MFILPPLGRVFVVFWQRLVWCGLVGCSLLPMLCQAQITLDGSLGPVRALRGPRYVIRAGDGQRQGPNLFHSFGEFNLLTGESVTFTGPGAIDNILSRVTGGNPSFIDGLLRSEIPGANLFLLNPSGVLFGPHATLDVNGSFHVSTADYLRLADGARFFAHLSAESVLSADPPAAFGFLGPQPPAPITVAESNLQVPEGATLSLVGGDITVAGGRLQAPGGRVQVASVAAAGEVVPRPTGLDVTTVERLGRIDLVQGTRVDTSGDGGGTVVIRGGQLRIAQSDVFADTFGQRDGAELALDLQVTERMVITQGSQVTADVFGDGSAGDIAVRADHLEVSQGALLGSRTLLNSRGAGGDVRLSTNRLTVTGGALIDGRTFGAGPGGRVTITAMEAVTLAGRDNDGSPSAITTSTATSGSAGSIRIVTPVLEMTGGRLLATGAAGAAGTIRLEVGQLVLTDGAQVNVNTIGQGRAGTVAITATEAITITGENAVGEPSGLLSNSLGPGAAGVLKVVTPTLTLNGGLMQTVSGGGDAGAILVQARRVTVTGGGQIDSRTDGAGQGGIVGVQATESLTLEGQGRHGQPSAVLSSTQGSGQAGIIRLEVGRLSILDGAAISGNTLGTGDGGTIQVIATDSILIRGRSVTGDPSRIVSNSFGSGTAGNVLLATPTLHLDDSLIQVAAGTGGGNAGLVFVEAQRVMVTGGAQIDSRTLGTGTGGGILVTASEMVRITGHNREGNPSALLSATEQRTAGAGNAGIIVLAAPRIVLADGGQIVTSTAGAGNAGTVLIGAFELMVDGLQVTGPVVEDLTLTGNARIASNALEGSSGQGGTLVIAASRVRLEESARMEASTLGAGDAGNIVIGTPRATVGDLTFLGTAVSEVSLTGGGQISASTSSGGAGGAVSITATDAVRIAGHDRAGTPSGLFSNTSGSGEAGSVAVNVPTLTMHDGVIQARSGTGGGAGGALLVIAERIALTGGAQIDSRTEGAGASGTMILTASDSLSLHGRDAAGNPSALVSTTSGRGDAQPIFLAAPTITLADGARIETSTRGVGDAGAIILGAFRIAPQGLQVTGPAVEQLLLTGGAEINSSSRGAGDGGLIAISAAARVEIRGRQSGLFSATQGAGEAGQILLAAPQVLLAEAGQIQTSTSGGGDAGVISIGAFELNFVVFTFVGQAVKQLTLTGGA